VVFGFLGEFLHKYFVEPGYDWVDTPTYGILLGVLVIFAVIPAIKRLGVRLDRRFFIGAAPFVLFGATARELVDRKLGLYALAGDYPGNFWLVSPWIFFTMFFLAVGCMLFGLLASRRFKGLGYHVPMFAVGGVLCLYNLLLIAGNVRNLALFFYVAEVAALFMVFIWFLSSFRLFSFLRNELNYVVVGAHLFDAAATFVGMDFLGFGEQHVLPSFLINYFGTAFVMFPLKLVVLLPALYLIDGELGDDETARRLIKFVVFVLGFGPAVRDVVMMVL